MKSEAVVAAEMNLLAIIRCHEALNFIYLSVLFIHLSSIPIPKHLLASSGMHLCHIFYLFTTSPISTLKKYNYVRDLHNTISFLLTSLLSTNQCPKPKERKDSSFIAKR